MLSALKSNPVRRSLKPKDWSDTDGSGKLSRKELEASLGKIRRASKVFRPLFRNSCGFEPFSRECCGALPEITDEVHACSSQFQGHSRLFSEGMESS